MRDSMIRLALLLIVAAAGCDRAQRSAATKAADEAPAPPPPEAAKIPDAPAPPAAASELAEAEASLARGETLYASMCAVCHGENGEGYKADEAPALAQQDFLASASDEYLGYAIADGRPGSTMSAWALSRGGPLTDDDINALITKLRRWQRQPDLQLDESPPRGDRSRGEQLFAGKCQRCHRQNGPQVRVTGHELLVHASNGFLRHAIKRGRPPTAMAAFQTELGEQGVEDVLSYLRSLPAWATPAAPSVAERVPPLPLGPIPIHPSGPEPRGFNAFPWMTSVDTVYAQWRRGARMVLLDARAPSDYLNAHVTGAVSVPFYDPAPYLARLPRDAWLVCYCGCPHAESGALAEKLLAAGFKRVTVLNEGLGAWTARHYPTQQGAP